jgi:hypothetical protein
MITNKLLLIAGESARRDLMRHSRIVPLGLVLLLLAVGCSGGDSATTLPPTTLPPPIVSPPILSPPTGTCAEGVERSLVVGETLTLTADDSDCLRLGAGEYIAVFYDARLIYPKKAHPWTEPSEFSVVVSDYSAGAPTQHASTQHAPTQYTPTQHASIALPVVGAAGHHPDHHHADELAVAQPLEGDRWPSLAEPAKVGDIVAMDTSLGFTPDRVVVLALVDGHQLIATPVDSVVPQVTLDGIVSLVEYFNAEHRQWLEELFGVVPSGDNGQYLIIIRPIVDGQTTSAWGTGGATSQTLWVPTQIWDPRPTDGGFGDAGMYRIFGHEYAHGYHGMFLRNDPQLLNRTRVLGFETWQVEGLADHIGYRMAAERAGIQLGANQFRSEWGFLREFVRFTGHIEFGYESAALKLWDFADRLAVATGMSWEAAHDSVSLAVTHNRWGCIDETSPEDPGDCEIYEGLYDMMQRSMPGHWDPIDAILLFALSQAADDLTSNPAVQNPHFRSTGDFGTMSDWVFFRMVGYEGDVKVRHFPAGAVSALRLGGPGAFKLESDIEGLRWKLIRIE